MSGAKCRRNTDRPWNKSLIGSTPSTGPGRTAWPAIEAIAPAPTSGGYGATSWINAASTATSAPGCRNFETALLLLDPVASLVVCSHAPPLRIFPSSSHGGPSSGTQAASTCPSLFLISQGLRQDHPATRGNHISIPTRSGCGSRCLEQWRNTADDGNVIRRARRGRQPQPPRARTPRESP